MTPAERLRAAATRLRERADVAGDTRERRAAVIDALLNLGNFIVAVALVTATLMSFERGDPAWITALVGVASIGALTDWVKRRAARAARKHIAEEGPLAGELDAAVWHRQFEKEKARAEEAERRVDELEPALARTRDERGEWKARHKVLRGDFCLQRDLAEQAEAERDGFHEEAIRHGQAALDRAKERNGWKAKHAALREDVEGMRERWLHDGVMLTHFDRVLSRDDERTPQADPDAVLGGEES